MSRQQVENILSQPKPNGLDLIELVEKTEPGQLAEIASIISGHFEDSAKIHWTDAPYSLASQPIRWKQHGFDSERQPLLDRALYLYVTELWLDYELNRAKPPMFGEDNGRAFIERYRVFLEQWDHLWTLDASQEQWELLLQDISSWRSPYVKLSFGPGRTFCEILAGLQLTETDRPSLLRCWEDIQPQSLLSFPGAPIVDWRGFLLEVRELSQENPGMDNNDLQRLFFELTLPDVQLLRQAWREHIDDALITLMLSQLLGVSLVPVSWRLGYAESA